MPCSALDIVFTQLVGHLDRFVVQVHVCGEEKNNKWSRWPLKDVGLKEELLPKLLIMSSSKVA